MREILLQRILTVLTLLTKNGAGGSSSPNSTDKNEVVRTSITNGDIITLPIEEFWSVEVIIYNGSVSIGGVDHLPGTYSIAMRSGLLKTPTIIDCSNSGNVIIVTIN